mmetsp:Transcript_3363/g.9148  ORF Transcript_3363/g.9148 Transcript_3363/m.9148 type:complete len:202 (-) Transcript_3363:301-906(-)
MSATLRLAMPVWRDGLSKQGQAACVPQMLHGRTRFNYCMCVHKGSGPCLTTANRASQQRPPAPRPAQAEGPWSPPGSAKLSPWRCRGMPACRRPCGTSSEAICTYFFRPMQHFSSMASRELRNRLRVEMSTMVKLLSCSIEVKSHQLQSTSHAENPRRAKQVPRMTRMGKMDDHWSARPSSMMRRKPPPTKLHHKQTTQRM